MRSLKKVLTLVLALVMVLGLVTIGASAAYTDDANIEYTDAVATTSALGIFNGYEDGSFNPNGTITRQETAKMIAVALNGGTFDPTLYADASMFNDVDGLWGEGYINYLAGLGILAGVGNDMFNPQGNITAQQLAKIMLVSLGYPEDLFVGSNWALYTNRIAITAGLYEDYTGAYSKVLTRDEAALIIYNALLTDCVQAAWAGSVSSLDDLNSWTWTSTGKTFLETKFKCEPNIGFVTATSSEYTQLTGTKVVVSYETADVSAAVANPATSSTTYLAFRGMSSATILDKVASYDGAIGTPVTVYTSTKTGAAVIAVAARTIETTTTSSITYSTTAAAATTTAMKTALLSAGFYNALVTANDTEDELDANYIEAADLTGNGVVLEFKQFAGTEPTDADYDLVGIPVAVGGIYYCIGVKDSSTFAPYYLGSVTSASYVFTPYNGGATTTVSKTASKNTTAFYNYDTLTKGQWYTIKSATTRATVQAAIATTYGSCTPITDIAAVTSVVGGIATAYSTPTVTVNGTAYRIAELAASVTQTGELNVNAITAAGVTDGKNTAKVYALANQSAASDFYGVDMFLDPYGYIFAAVASDSTAAAVGDYAYIIGADVSVTGSGVFATCSAKVQVLTDNGTYAIYDLALVRKTDGYFYSGSYKFATTADTTVAETAITNELTNSGAGNVFSYTVSNGVFTVVAQATSDDVYSDYNGATSTVAANAYIVLDAGTYVLNSDTEFVYMNIASTVSKSTATSVGLSAAQDIDANATVFFVLDTTNTSLITKLIVIGEYTATAKEAYIFVDASTKSVTWNSTDGTMYTYNVYYADGTLVEAGITVEQNISSDAVYYLNDDGTIGTDSYIGGGVIASINGSTIGITASSTTTYYQLASGTEAVLIGDDATYEVGAGVLFATNSAGAISGIWSYIPVS